MKSRRMSAESFCAWLDEIQERGLATSQREVADILDVDPMTIIDMKRRGADLRTAYACQAILSNLEPYGENA